MTINPLISPIISMIEFGIIITLTLIILWKNSELEILREQNEELRNIRWKIKNKEGKKK